MPSPFKARTSLFVILLLVALLTAAAAWLLPNPPPAAPAVSFTLLDGSTRTLAELRGRPVLIDFWATSCPPCVEELPDLIRLYGELRPLGFELVAVAMPYDPPLRVQEIRDRFAIPYPIALDVRGEAVAAFGGVSLIPAAFLIDPEGRVIYEQVGRLDTERVRRLVGQLQARVK